MKRSRFVLLFVGASIFVWLFLFYRFLIGLDGFGYRDTAHFYYPLFEWIQEQWRRGTIPLWNPQDDFGTPVIGDGVTSVFYPLKAIFFLNTVPNPVLFCWYVSIHVLIAAWGGFFLARRLGCSRAGSILAAAGYSLSGSVLFQVNNVVYLVGAAWLPWAIGWGYTAIRDRRSDAIIGAATAIAFMVLGGDPLSAYHTLLILGVVAVSLLKRDAAAARRRLGLPATAFAAIVVLAIGLSAIQWLPSYQWYQRSIRAASETQRSVWESLSGWQFGDGFRPREWLANPPAGTHHEQIYQFSQPPWSFVELIWPNISGKEFPFYRRWTNAIPAADRVWSPSLYCGFLVFLLAVVGARGRSGPGIPRAVTWLTMLFALGSLGWYGVGWLARELTGNTGVAGEVQPSAFGVYWWMVTLLPGYASFRYPAKLMVVASLGICLLAGMQFSHLNDARRPYIIRLCASIFIGSLIGLRLTFVPGLSPMMDGIPADASFGPFDSRGAIVDLRTTFTHACIVAGLVGIAIRRSRIGLGMASRTNGVLIALTIADLILANSWLLPSVPAGTFSNREYNESSPIPGSEQWPRRIRAAKFRSSRAELFSRSSSPDRLAEIIVDQKLSAFPKFHLTQGIDLIGSMYALEPSDLIWLRQQVSDKAVWNARVEEVFWLPRLSPLLEGADLLGLVEDWQPAEFSRQLILRPKLKSRLIESARDDLIRLQMARDLSSTRVPMSTKHATAFFRSREASHSQIHVQTTMPVWLVVKEYWDPDWQVTITNTASGVQLRPPIERFAGIFRAVRIPAAGQFEVSFVYRPAAFGWGLAITVITLCGLIISGFAIFVRRYFVSSASP